MIDLEQRLRDQLTAAVEPIDVSPPSSTEIVRRVERRHRRRALARGVIGVATVVLMVGGIVVVSGREADRSKVTSDPNPSGPVTGPTLAIPDTTLNVSDTWAALPPNQLSARSQHVLVGTPSGLFVWGGYNSTGVLTDGAFWFSADKVWRTIPPAPLTPERGDGVAVWTGSEVVVMNGDEDEVRAAAFDPQSFAWRALTDPPIISANAVSQAAVVDGRVVLFSVLEDGVAPIDQVAVLDPVEDTWTMGASPPVTMRSGLATVTVQGTEVFVVGQDSTTEGCPTLRVQAYSPADDSWRELDAAPVARLADPVVAWTGTELFVGGGGSCEDGVASFDFETSGYLLDPATGSWRETAPAPVGFYGATRYSDGWTGGAVGAITPDGAPLLYNPTTDAWHVGPALNPAVGISPNETPILVDGKTITIAGGAFTESSGTFRGTYVYTAPPGWS